MKHFITTGCSFTAGIIPLPHNEAGYWGDRGSVWPHFCFSKMNPTKDTFINLAVSGGGNRAAFTNLIYVLETNKDLYRPENTLIGINITGMHRYDIIADSKNNDKINKDLCCVEPAGLQHISETLGFGWITDKHLHNVKNDILSAVTVIQSFSYLELNKYNYFFMLMNEPIYYYSLDFFKQCLDKRKSNWITFDRHLGMFEFAKHLNQLTKDGHPSIDGHKSISKYVIDHINKNYKDFLDINE